MWSYVSRTIAGSFGQKTNSSRGRRTHSEFSDEDKVLFNTAREEGLECPICWEHFNVVENVPYVLWCGHSLCKNCVLGLQRAIVRFSTLPLQLPLFVSCPWCNLLSFRLVYKGNLRFPRKNFFLLWMVESMNGDRTISQSSMCSDHKPSSSMNFTARQSTAICRTPINSRPILPYQPHHQLELRNRFFNRCLVSQNPHHQLEVRNCFFNRYLILQNLQVFLHKSFVFFARLMVKFPLIIIFLLIVLYVIPVVVTILAVYAFVTVLFAFPSFLILYFVYPCLDWLIKKITN